MKQYGAHKKRAKAKTLKNRKKRKAAEALRKEKREQHNEALNDSPQYAAWKKRMGLT